jgi:hypothetical protein
MLRSLRKSLATMVAGLALAVVPAVAIPAVASAQADIQGGLKCGTTLDALNKTDCEADTTKGAENVNKMITTIINIFSVLVGIVSVIMIIWGGFKYVTSGGDSGNVTSAKNTIIYAVIGLVVVALAQFIVQFVLEKVTGTE